MCEVCQFTFTGGTYLCPECASRPETGLSKWRKTYIVWAYILAAWASLGMVLTFTGALAGFAQDMGETGFGILLAAVVFLPSIIGTALGISTIERRLSNPPVLWGAAIWNGLVMGGFLLMIVVGLTMG
jgi:hypothetical protein